MTSQEYKDCAKANGYDLGLRTDAELLSDYAFHKAACVGMEPEAVATFKSPDFPPAAALMDAHVLRLILALTETDKGKSESEVWTEVCKGGKKQSDIHDANGALISSKL